MGKSLQRNLEFAVKGNAIDLVLELLSVLLSADVDVLVQELLCPPLGCYWKSNLQV
jgi:hypothetical protein